MNTFLKELSGFWNSLEISQRISLIGTTLLVLLGAAALYMWVQTPNMRLLYGGLDIKDASTIVAHLESQNIPYEMRNGGTAIFVPERAVYRARMEVATQGLVGADAVGFEIFDQNTFGVSDFVQRTNFIRAIQGELARTIVQLNGVRAARVMVVMPDNRLLMVNNDIKPSASVFVELGGSTLSVAAVRAIQALVAGSVEGLVPDRVTVVDNHGNKLSVTDEANTALAQSASFLDYRQNLENYFTGKVESMLVKVVGSGNVVVRVAVDIDLDSKTQVEERFDPNSAVARTVRSEEQTRNSTQPARGEVASLNLDELDVNSQGGMARSDEERRSRQQDFEIDRTITNINREPGSIRNTTVSVFLAARRSADGETENPRSAAELAALRALVANAVGIPLSAAEAGAVTIQETVFSHSNDVMVLASGMGSLMEISTLLGFRDELVGIVLTLFLFFAFLFLYRKSKSQHSVLDDLQDHLETTVQKKTNPGLPEVTPDLLNELIKQKPDHAATTLKNWLEQR